MTIVEQIKIGDRVRSFDFENRDVEGERACYVEGVVTGVGAFDNAPGCDRYEIVVDRMVWRGESRSPAFAGTKVYPPVNGTPVVGRAQEVTDGVVLLGLVKATMYQYWDVVIGFKTHSDTLIIGRVDANTELKAYELGMARFRKFFQLLDPCDEAFVIEAKCIG